MRKSLSVDISFVFVLLFSYFAVPGVYQHRVIFWEILGALVMRAILIGLGTALLEEFHWIIYSFGAFLIFTGIRVALHKDEEIRIKEYVVVRLFRRFMLVDNRDHGSSFFVRHAGKLMATPLFLVLLVVESSGLGLCR